MHVAHAGSILPRACRAAQRAGDPVLQYDRVPVEDMIPFSDCRRCMEAPRELRWFWVGDEKARSYPDIEAVWRMPESLGLVGSDRPYSRLWKCPDCGTYYGLDVFERGSWPRASCQITLWRLTHAEAIEECRRRLPQYVGERRHFEVRMPEWMRETQALLSHTDSTVRERAAMALASHFRARSELAGAEALLGNADASIRRGALLAFDSIRFVSLERGPADIVPDLLKALMDPDASVARQAFVLLSRVHDEVYSRWSGIRGALPDRQAKHAQQQIRDQLNAIPAGRRNAAVRMFLLSNGGSFDELVAGLSDSDKEVRQCAFYHALKVSLGNTPFVTRLRTTLRAIPETDRTWEMDAYLARENPDEWDDD